MHLSIGLPGRSLISYGLSYVARWAAHETKSLTTQKHQRTLMALKTVYFLSLLFVALALAPAMAHLLELPNKINLSRDDYLTMQQIYRGWALLGFIVIAALLSEWSPFGTLKIP
jgi:hypothetical protein